MSTVVGPIISLAEGAKVALATPLLCAVAALHHEDGARPVDEKPVILLLRGVSRLVPVLILEVRPHDASVDVHLASGNTVLGRSSWEAAPNLRSIASAPDRSTGRSSCRYTVSVVRLELWPTRCAISSTLMPPSDISETKVWRSSRGVQHSPIPASRQTFLKRFLTFDGSSGVPTEVVKTRPCSRQRPSAALRSTSCSSHSIRSACATAPGRARVRRDLDVLVSPPARTDRHT